jgi:hypothetical protein
MARLSKSLHCASRNSVFPSYFVDGHLIAQVSELEGSIEALVDSSDLLLYCCRLDQISALCPMDISICFL